MQIYERHKYIIVETKFGPKLHGHRHIHTKSLHQLYKDVVKKHEFLSMSSFYRLKPFYILSPSLRETQTCGSIKCMNPHSIYSTIRMIRTMITQCL